MVLRGSEVVRKLPCDSFTIEKRDHYKTMRMNESSESHTFFDLSRNFKPIDFFCTIVNINDTKGSFREKYHHRLKSKLNFSTLRNSYYCSSVFEWKSGRISKLLFQTLLNVELPNILSDLNQMLYCEYKSV